MKQSEALDILKMGHNVFLTGSPGSGKTHTINEYVAYLRAHDIEPAITASTGISATHIGGLTIHSWSGIGIKSALSPADLKKISTTTYITKRVRRAKVLIIDEVSMLSPETFSMIDEVCREIKDKDAPFGGLQMVAVGDFFQLPPVVKREVEEDLQMTLTSESYGRFAYDSPAWQRAKLTVCYLTEQHRQDDADFLQLLSAIRANEFGAPHLEQIQSRKILGHQAPENVPKLFSHNIDVDRVNSEILAKLPGESKEFFMHAQGPAPLVAFLKKSCLSPENLFLKVGAAVMFTKNNQKEGFVNGTLGVVAGFSQDTQEPMVKTRDGRHITVEAMDWALEENGRPLAHLSQLPLRLAWAITVHKSQGMSLDEAVMDLGNVFEYGQGYVALSRVRRLSGLHMLGFNEHAFKVHPDVLEKDRKFQKQSDSAIADLAEMKKGEIEKKSQQFIVACGGRPVQSFVGKHASAGHKAAPGLAYLPWDEKQDSELYELFTKKLTIAEMALAFNRTKGSIRSRLIKLKILET